LSVDEIYAIYVEHGVEVTREEVEKLVEEADKVTKGRSGAGQGRVGPGGAGRGGAGRGGAGSLL
jgi:hypothetical protein